MSTQSSEPLLPRRAVWLLLLILMLAAAVRIWEFHGYGGLDDAEYARFAYLVAQGRDFPQHYEGPAVFPLRVGTFVPVAAAFRLFGVSEWSMVLYPLMLSLISVVLAYCCAGLFFGWRAGVIAAAILGTYHWDIDSATRLLPDLPAAFFAGVGICILAALATRPARSSRLLAGGIAAGIAFGVAWLCKESVSYLAPFCLAFIYLSVKQHGRSIWPLWGGFVAASLSVLLVETFYYYASTGDLLFRFHEVERNYRQWANGFFTEGSDYGWASGMSRSEAILRRLFIWGPATLFFDESLYYMPLVGLLATIHALWRRDKSFLIPAVWFWSLVLMFNFMSSSLSSYVPLALYYRYIYPLYLPSIVLAAGLLTKTLLENRSLSGRSDRWKPALGVAAVAIVLFAAVPRLYFGLTALPTSWLAEVRTFHDKVSPETQLYSDPLTLRGFEFFAEYPQQTRWTAFEQLPAGGEIPEGSLVIVNRRYLDWLNRNAGMWVTWPGPAPMDLHEYRNHAFYEHPPSTWSEVWKNANARVYQVGGAKPETLSQVAGGTEQR